MTVNFDVESLTSLRLEPGDIVVLKVAFSLSYESEKHLRETAEMIFPGHQVIVLEDGISLEVQKKDEAE